MSGTAIDRLQQMAYLLEVTVNMGGERTSAFVMAIQRVLRVEIEMRQKAITALDGATMTLDGMRHLTPTKADAAKAWNDARDAARFLAGESRP